MPRTKVNVNSYYGYLARGIKADYDFFKDAYLIRETDVASITRKNKKSGVLPLDMSYISKNAKIYKFVDIVYDNKYGTRYVYSASSIKNEPKYSVESVFNITFRDGIVRNKKMCEMSKLIKNKKLTCSDVSFKDIYMKENGNVFTFYGGFVTIDKRHADTIVFLSLTPDTNL